MKKFILLAFFAIGMMVMLPASGYSSESPPGQVSFVAAHFDIATAMAIVQEIAFVYEFNQLAPVAAMVQEKGGAAIEKSLNTYLATGYCNKNVINDPTDFTLIKNYDFRICRLLKQIESQITAKNNESNTRCTIRADSRV